MGSLHHHCTPPATHQGTHKHRHTAVCMKRDLMTTHWVGMLLQNRMVLMVKDAVCIRSFIIKTIIDWRAYSCKNFEYAAPDELLWFSFSPHPHGHLSSWKHFSICSAPNTTHTDSALWNYTYPLNSFIFYHHKSQHVLFRFYGIEPRKTIYVFNMCHFLM